MSVIGRIRDAIRSKSPGHDYECKGCGSGFDLQRQVCPNCGGYRIEYVEWDEE